MSLEWVEFSTNSSSDVVILPLVGDGTNEGLGHIQRSATPGRGSSMVGLPTARIF